MNIDFNSIDWNAVTAITAIVVAVLTAIFQLVESRRSRKALHQDWLLNSANMVTTFVNDYYSENMRNERKRFSAKLLEVRDQNTRREKAGQHEFWGLHEIGLENIQPLSFFENIGYLARIGVLDKEMVWSNFFWELNRYYTAITVPVNLLQQARLKDKYPSLFQETEWLYRELLRIDSSFNKIEKPNSFLNTSQIEEFLRREMTQSDNTPLIQGKRKR